MNFEAILDLKINFTENVGKDLRVEFIHSWGLGLPNRHPSLYLTMTRLV